MELRFECLRIATDIYNRYLSASPPLKQDELWNEHLEIRKGIQKISDMQNRLGDTSALLNDKRSPRTLDFFNQWAKKRGIEHDLIEISPWGKSGYQLKAKRDIQEDEVVLNVPYDAMLSHDLMKTSMMFKKAIANDPVLSRMDNVALTIFLCAERLSNNSQWIPYLDILPYSFDIPIYYEVDDILALKPSPVFDDVLLFYRSIARQFCYFYLQTSSNELYTNMRRQRRTNEAPPLLYTTPFTLENFTFDLYRWAVSIVSTRINLIPSKFGYDTDGGPCFAPTLIPVLDMANHEFLKETSVAYVGIVESAQIKANKKYAKGDAITIDYGRRSNAEHLIYNGFVPEGNRADYYKMRIALPKNDAHFKEKVAKLIELNIMPWMQEHVFEFKVYVGPIPITDDLLNFIRVVVAEELTDEVLSSKANMEKAVCFLKNRFSILHRSYANLMVEQPVEHGKLVISLKETEVRLLEHARDFCILWEQSAKEGIFKKFSFAEPKNETKVAYNHQIPFKVC